MKVTKSTREISIQFAISVLKKLPAGYFVDTKPYIKEQIDSLEEELSELKQLKLRRMLERK